MCFADELVELRDCCDETLRALSLLPDEPALRQRMAERRLFAVELSALAGGHRGPRRLSASLQRAWRAASRAMTRLLHGPSEDVEELEHTLLRRYELACEASPPMSVGSVLLRQHDALKRAEFRRRLQPSTMRVPAEPLETTATTETPRRTWPELPSLGRTLGAPSR